MVRQLGTGLIGIKSVSVWACYSLCYFEIKTDGSPDRNPHINTLYDRGD